MPKYTFSFDRTNERHFNNVLERLEPAYYIIHRPVEDFVDPKHPNDKRKSTVMEMDTADAVQFTMAMGNDINIRRERTEDELVEEKALHDANTVKITVKVNGLPPPVAP